MITKYAKELLIGTNCNLDCYKGIEIETIEKDLKTYYDDELTVPPYPIRTIALALREIGDEQPDPPRKGHKRFMMLWDNDSCCDGTEHDTFEAAMFDAEETLLMWLCDEQSKWEIDENGVPHPTEEQIESYDYMIYNCEACVVEWDEEAGEYESIDYASYPSEDAVEWKTWNELKEKYGW